ncbi:MAG: hypothetical protein EP330_30030 [Deltaproteobacteria bacterium]|nr:MAG: hypothetical protein EP330_30030 [Deltaproteobacteria bacterium]
MSAPIAVRVLRARALRHRAVGHLFREIPASLRPFYAMTPRETRFVRALLADHPNLWLYRVHQQRFAGDFAVIDMSSPRWERRPLFVVDLKLGAPVRLGRGPAGVQLLRVPELVDTLRGLRVSGSEPILATGDGQALHAWLGSMDSG